MSQTKVQSDATTFPDYSYLSEAANFTPDWVAVWPPVEAEKQLEGFKWNGPGWYLEKQDTFLVLPTNQPGIFSFHVYNDRNPAKAFNQIVNAPCRSDEDGIFPEDKNCKLDAGVMLDGIGLHHRASMARIIWDAWPEELKGDRSLAKVAAQLSNLPAVIISGLRIERARMVCDAINLSGAQAHVVKGQAT